MVTLSSCSLSPRPNTSDPPETEMWLAEIYRINVRLHRDAYLAHGSAMHFPQGASARAFLEQNHPNRREQDLHVK